MRIEKVRLLHKVALALLLVNLLVLAFPPIQIASAHPEQAFGFFAPPGDEPDPGAGEPDDGGTIDGVLQDLCEVTGQVCKIVQEINSFVTHTILFPFSTMRDALANAMTDMSKTAVEKMETSLGRALRASISWLYADNVTENIRRSGWISMATVAGFLIPVVLIVTVGGALKDGAQSVTGVAAAREALIEFFVAIGLAGGSYFLLSKLIGLSNAVTSTVAKSLVDEWKIDFSSYLVGTFVSMVKITSLGTFVQMFLGIFAVLMVIVVVSSLLMAFLSREVMMLLLTILAPLVLVLGVIRDARWLLSLWMKALFFSLMLGPINMLMLGIGGMLYTNAIQGVGKSAMLGDSGQFVSAFLGILVAIGVASLLVKMNMAVSEMIYGAAMDVAGKAIGTVGDIAKAVVAVGAVALGAPAVMGALGSAGAGAASAAGAGAEAGVGAAGAGAAGSSVGAGAGAGAGGAGAGMGTGGSGSAGGRLAARDPRQLREEFGFKTRAAKLAQQIGSNLSRFGGHPITSAFGAAANALGSQAEMRALNEYQQSMGQQAQEQQTVDSRMNDVRDIGPGHQEGVADITAAAQSGTITTGVTGDAVSHGIAESMAGFQAAHMVGISPGQYVAQLTDYDPAQPVDRFDDHVAAVTRADISQAIGADGLHQVRPYEQIAENSPTPTVADVRFSMGVLRENANTKSVDPDYVAGMAYATAQARNIGGMSYPDIAAAATKYNGQTGTPSVENWVRDQGRAAPIHAEGYDYNAPMDQFSMSGFVKAHTGKSSLDGDPFAQQP